MAMIIASLRPLARVCGRTSHLLPSVRRSSPRKNTWLCVPLRADGLGERVLALLDGDALRQRVLVDAHDVRPGFGEADDVGALGVGDPLADLLAGLGLDDDADVGDGLADVLAVLLELVEHAALDALRCVVVALGRGRTPETDHRRHGDDEHDESARSGPSETSVPNARSCGAEGTRPVVSTRHPV